MHFSFLATHLFWITSIVPISMACESGVLLASSLPRIAQHTEIATTVQDDAVKSHHSHHCKRGPRGHRGKQGKRGHRGPTGATGMNGIEGPTGPTGATGMNGIEGPTGPTGATGTEGITTYASLYVDNGPTIAAGSTVLFNQVAALNGGINFTTGTGSITIIEDGVYEINIGMLFSASTSTTISFNLMKNAISIPGARIAAPTASTIRTTEYTNSIITNLNIGDVLTLTNSSSISVQLDGSGNVDTYITIKRIA